MHTVEVPVEALAHESFRESGQIIGELDQPPARQRPRLTSKRASVHGNSNSTHESQVGASSAPRYTIV